METMNSGQFERNGTPLYYRHWHAGENRPTLLLCHGLASNGTRWREFAESMAPPGAESDWQIICPDLRGMGQSPDRGRISAEIWADDLAALLDHLGIESAVIGGHCLGANLSLRFALAHPEKTDGLVLIEPMFAHALTGRLRKLARVRWLLPAIAGIARGINALGIYRRRLPNLDLTELDQNTREMMAAADGHLDIRQRYARPSRDRLYMPTAAYLQSLNEVLRSMPSLSPIKAPALTLLSKGALFGDPFLTEQKLEELSQVTVETLSALHWIPTEQPEAMRLAISRWLEVQLEKA